ncbi:MAG: alpha-glucosidase [Clostridiales bacterium]|nr:alpha-glucosidase [Clostridiales bacterium]
MIRKYVYGQPFETEAVTEQIPEAKGIPAYGRVDVEQGFCFTCRLEADDVVYGLGEANRGINKRGNLYVSNCTDCTEHTEELRSLYGAHNFLVVSGQESFGLFVDYPAKLSFDVGYTRTDTLRIFCDRADLYLYVIDGESAYDIVRQFRGIIGRSYIPPRFAFGFGQSRWEYRTADDLRRVADGYRENHIPLDMLYMDIDYMCDYKDFTLNEEAFPDFPEFVREMKARGIRLVPIIDAGVKVEEGYPVYEEGRERRLFCQNEDGSDFTAAAWPGAVHFPDVLNPGARQWFGDQYRFLTDQGIEGFWNDMNEPSIFYTKERLEKFRARMREYVDSAADSMMVFEIGDAVGALSGNLREDEAVYHQVGEERVRHDRVHNLYGYNMTRAAAEGLARIDPNRRFLLFSRSSYIGMHRFSGIWTGDNRSWWSHLLLNLKMMPSLNMCGFLYAGADLGGFGADATQDLLLRWLAFGLFMPLMRNHSSLGTREQECYQFEDTDAFRHVVGVRYRLIPYLYSEYMKAALGNEMYVKPLAFVYPQDKLARETEDQLMLGDEIMIAPVYTQNASGRYVYLPEEMKFVRFLRNGTISEEILGAGHHYVEIALDEVPMFIRHGRCVPVAEPAECMEEIDTSHLRLLGYAGAEYLLYEDDGISVDYEKTGSWRRLRAEGTKEKNKS